MPMDSPSNSSATAQTDHATNEQAARETPATQSVVTEHTELGTPPTRPLTWDVTPTNKPADSKIVSEGTPVTPSAGEPLPTSLQPELQWWNQLADGRRQPLKDTTPAGDDRDHWQRDGNATWAPRKPK